VYSSGGSGGRGKKASFTQKRYDLAIKEESKIQNFDAFIRDLHQALPMFVDVMARLQQTLPPVQPSQVKVEPPRQFTPVQQYETENENESTDEEVQFKDL